MEKIPALCLEIVPCVFSLLFFLSCWFQCRWSICSIHFIDLSSLVLVLKDVVVNEQHTSMPLCYFSAHGVSSFDILLYLLLLLKNAITYGLVFVHTVCVHNMLVFCFRLTTEAFYSRLSVSPTSLTPEHKIQSPKLAAIY